MSPQSGTTPNHIYYTHSVLHKRPAAGLALHHVCIDIGHCLDRLWSRHAVLRLGQLNEHVTKLIHICQLCPQKQRFIRWRIGACVRCCVLCRVEPSDRVRQVLDPFVPACLCRLGSEERRVVHEHSRGIDIITEALQVAIVVSEHLDHCQLRCPGSGMPGVGCGIYHPSNCVVDVDLVQQEGLDVVAGGHSV